jgi:hypothetical protein
VTVLCLNRDSRQFGISSPPEYWKSADVLLLIADHPDTVVPALSSQFTRIEMLPTSAVTLHGRTLKVVTVAIGRGFAPPINRTATDR